jgi:hypothetical protein
LAASDTRQGAVANISVGAHGVWIVTRRFGVFFRVGITANKHEGKDWLAVPAPAMAREFVPLSVWWVFTYKII